MRLAKHRDALQFLSRLRVEADASAEFRTKANSADRPAFPATYTATKPSNTAAQM
jgi:hypothetical protein